ncbi:MAG: LTA synthase family protein [Clostridiaceae bacterium]|nr:LTA synthase family protein [Clostridiaceae bacterium]
MKKRISEKISKEKIPYISIDRYVTNILFVILLSMILSFVGIMLSDVVSISNLLRYIRAPLLFVLNTLPLTLLMLLLYHLTSRHWVSFGFGGGIYIVSHVVNRFMMLLREEPLTPQDLLLGIEAATVIKISELPFTPIIILSLLFWLLVSVGLFLFVKSGKLPLAARIAGPIAAILLFVAVFSPFYKDSKRYESFDVTGTIYSRVDLFKSRGFLYSFLVRAGTYKSIKPENYVKEEAQQILDNYAEPPYTLITGRKPHIIAVMGEAFYDIDKIEGAEFNEGFDPLVNFNRICRQAYAGKIVTNVFGGGTANTEFSFLTGHSMPIMPDLSSPYSYYIRRDTFSLARELEKAGYITMAFHPGDSWFYNRQNVYKFFGFDSIYFKNNMDQSSIEVNHGYISDRSTAEFALEKFREHLSEKPDRPFFQFIVDIDNHGPYSKRDLGYPQILKRKDIMDEATYNILNNYTYGLMRCDKALGFLFDSISDMNEPVVLLYFSDHLPFLGENDLGYKQLGFNISGDSMEAYLNKYKTPYFIWCNEAAKAQAEAGGIKVPTGTAPLISSNYIASELLEFIGLDGGNYFNYLYELKEELPMITNRFYLEDGEFTQTPSEHTKALIDEYVRLQYYMMMEEETR